MLLFGAILAGGLLLAIAIWRRYHNIDRQISRAAKKLVRLGRRGHTGTGVASNLVWLFDLLEQGIASRNTALCYKVVDVLKLAYGEGACRTDEVFFISSAITAAMRSKQADVASFLIDTLRPLIRRLQQEKVAEAIEYLQMISVIALRERQNYLAAKSAELIFSILEKNENQDSLLISDKALNMLKITGSLAIRRKDCDLLREFAAKLSVGYFAAKNQDSQAIIRLFAAWIHRVYFTGDDEAYKVVADLLLQWKTKRQMQADIFSALISEISNQAGAASLNPNSSMAEKLVGLILELGFSGQNINEWKIALRTAGEVIRLAIYNHKLTPSFPVVFPILEYGRRMLVMELKFGGVASEGSFRQQALFWTVRETLTVIEFSARQKMTYTAADIIEELAEIWAKHPERYYTVKSFQKYCGVLVLYLAANRRAKRQFSSLSKTALTGFNQKERGNLRFLFGWKEEELVSGVGFEV